MIRLYLGDTLSLDVVLTDDAGQPLDLTDATVTVTYGAVTAAATIDPDPTTGRFTYAANVATAGVFQIRYRVAANGAQFTQNGDSLRVVNPDAQWASLADVEAIFGPQDDPAAVEAAIDFATALIYSWLCAPVPDPLPPEFTMATALIAGRLVQAPAPGSPIAETIGDYSYRLAVGPNVDGLRAEVRQLLGPWLCGTIHSVRVWPPAGGCGCEAAQWAWNLYLDCFDSVDGMTDGYQPDAEGFIRG